MSLCEICYATPQYCRARKVPIVTDAQLDSDKFRIDVRTTLKKATGQIPFRQRLDFLADLYRDADCADVVDAAGTKRIFGLDHLEFDGVEYWLRDLCDLPPTGSPTRLPPVRRKAFGTLATLLKLLFPAESLFWRKPACDGSIRWTEEDAASALTSPVSPAIDGDVRHAA